MNPDQNYTNWEFFCFFSGLMCLMIAGPGILGGLATLPGPHIYKLWAFLIAVAFGLGGRFLLRHAERRRDVRLYGRSVD